MRRVAAFAVIVVLILSSVAVAPAISAEGDTEGAAARNLTLEELRPGGTKPANAPPSVRQNGQYGEFVVKNLPTGLLVSEDQDPNSQSWQYLEPGTTVRRNWVQLWSKRAYGAENQKYVVEIAHYQVGQKTIESKEGSTRTEQVAKNVTTYSKTVTFGGGYDYAKINLRSHYEENVRTVMCVREPNEASCLESPGQTRWTYYHASSKATIPVDTNSAGGRLAWGLGFLVLPFFAMTTGTLFVGRKFVRRAKAGPQISAIWWVIVAVVGLLFLVLGWDWLSDTLIRAPWIVSAVAGILLGVIAVEWFGHDTYGAGFLQFQLTEGYDPTDPSDDDEDGDGPDEHSGADLDEESTRPQDAPGVLKAQFHIAQFARGDKGERSAIRRGIRKFWARARGATADLEVDGNMQTRIDVDGPLDELYLLDPEDEEPLDYVPEHHEVSIPPLMERDEEGRLNLYLMPYIAGLAALGMGWVAGSVLTGSGLLGVLVAGLGLFATKIAKPREGRLWANLAPVHYNHAVGAMLTHARGLSNAKGWEDWFRNYAESEAETQADRQELLDDRSESQMDQLYKRYVGDGEEDAPIRSNSDQEASTDD